MSRLKVVLLAAFAALAIGAVASGSASAEECKAGEATGDVALCIEKEEVGSVSAHAPVPFTSKKKAGSLSKLEVTNGPTIKCGTAANTGEFDMANGNIVETPGKSVEISDLSITFKECKVTNSKTTE
jgi:hypothetical protein